MELNTLTLSDFVRLANVIFEKEMSSLGQEARNSGLFIVDNIPQNSGNTREYTEIDLEEYAKYKGEDDQATRARVKQGYSKVITSYRVALDIGISYEMRTQNKYTEVMRRLTSLARTAVNRMELDLTHRLTFGTATSYTDMDGRTIDISVGNTLALFSTAHTLRGSSSTYRNRLANNPAISRGAIEGMELLCTENTLNQFGQKVVIPFDILWTTDDPNTVNTVMEYLRSVASPDATNSGVTNVYKAKYRHVILPRLNTDKDGSPDTTKRKYWGLASSLYSTAHLSVWEEPRMTTPPVNGNNAEDRQTDAWEFGVRAGYGICIVNGSWIKFSSGDATA